MRGPLRLQMLAALAVAVGGVAAFGAVRGVITSAVAVPATLWMLARLPGLRPSPRPDESLPMALDLVAAGLRSGRALPGALGWAATAVAGDDAQRFTRVAALLRDGHEPAQAWTAARDGPLDDVARVAIRSANSGARLATAYEQLAARLRADLSAAVIARAHRASVLVMAPIGLCFLPAFVCLGIVPVLVGVARTVITGLR